MGDGAGAVNSSASIGTPDFNRDGFLDTIEWRWAYKAIAGGFDSYSYPIITVAKVKVKDEFVDLRTTRSLQACGKEFTIGNKFEDSKKTKNPITRIVTGFTLNVKQEKNKVSGSMEYGLRLFAKLEPAVPDGTHRKSSRLICGPFFDVHSNISANDPDKYRDAASSAVGLP